MTLRSVAGGALYRSAGRLVLRGMSRSWSLGRAWSTAWPRGLRAESWSMDLPGSWPGRGTERDEIASPGDGRWR